MNLLLSVDVGHGNLHIVEGNCSKGTVFVERAATSKIPESCVSRDTVENRELFISTLWEAIRRFKFVSKDAVLTINAFDAIVREISLPNAKLKEITSMIKNELMQTYHAEPTDIIQYKSIEKEINEKGSVINKYRAAAIDREVVDAYHQVLVGAKMKPVAMDLNFNAVDKLLSGNHKINDKILNRNATMLLDFGETLTTAYIILQGKPIFHRHINIGCREIERHIFEETFTPEEEVRKLMEDGYNFFGNGEENKYYNILRPYFYHFVDEVRKIIEFYTSRPDAESIDQIFLFGGGSNLSGFSDYCESSFKIPAEKIEKLSKVKFKDPATPIAPYMNAIGALIRL